MHGTITSISKSLSVAFIVAKLLLSRINLAFRSIWATSVHSIHFGSIWSYSVHIGLTWSTLVCLGPI